MRESGILMHITSLPGPYGIGSMGREAFRFVDFLSRAGQSYWQILPINPTGYGDSPYQSCSIFAGNHYLIDLQALLAQGLLREEELEAVAWCRREEKVDFGILYENRLWILRLAYSRFADWERLKAFCEENRAWLLDFSLFMALKERYQGKPWYEWPRELKFRDKAALAEARRSLSQSVRFFSFVQYLFYTQWQALRDYAHGKGIRIIGDVPIYVPRDSVEVWCAPQLFQLDEELTPTVVAGVPPDGFTADGQLWGNPVYRWEAHKKSGYRWWLRRLAFAGTLYDVIRLDHFRGFEAYWAVPYGEATAKGGVWMPGPGMDFFRAIQRELPRLSMIAEDLGFLTEEVLELRDNTGYPGMKVLEFAFDSREPSDYLPHTYIPNTVCYVGTHDNMTMRQWFETSSQESVAYATEYLALTKKEGLVWGAIRAAMASVSNLCVVQMQDYLNLGAEARMNFPGTTSDANWTWRMHSGAANRRLAKKIYALTRLYDRLGTQKES